MIENIEDLRVKTEGQMLRDWNLFGHVDLGVGEMRSSVVVAAGVAELAVGGLISTCTRAGAEIDDGSESIRVEPLTAAGLRHASN